MFDHGVGHHEHRFSCAQGDLIQIRASAATKAILNRAAATRGQKLSEFMLDSARARAEEIILDQRLFALDDDTYRQFIATLDAPRLGRWRAVAAQNEL